VLVRVFGLGSHRTNALQKGERAGSLSSRGSIPPPPDGPSSAASRPACWVKAPRSRS
jgi:hypothetical protein